MATQFTEIMTAIGSSSLISSVITFFATRKSHNVDISQKTIDFWERKADNYLERIIVLEEKVNAFEQLRCDKPDCKNRI
jgi:galactitol-specific phosphotransferase system IIB component